MRTAALLTLVALAPLTLARAGDDAPSIERGFSNGKYVDQYFGISYTIPGLVDEPSLEKPMLLFGGKTSQGLEVAILIQESADAKSPAEWFAHVKKLVGEGDEKPTDVQEGQDPHPWMLYVKESWSGDQRHHAIAVYPRGRQCFLCHAFLGEKTESSASILKDAVLALQVEPKEQGFWLVTVASRQLQKPLTDPEVLLAAGDGYVEQDESDPKTALRVLAAAEAAAGENGFDDAQKFQLAYATGMAELKLRRLDEGIANWEKAVELAPKSKSPERLLPNARYNLACAYALAKRTDDAFKVLKLALDGWPAEDRDDIVANAKADEDLASLRQDPRWEALFADGAKKSDGAGEGGGN